MSKFSLNWIRKVTGGQIINQDLSCPINGVSTDSREVNPHDLFVCLPGQRTDGHFHLPEAYHRGAGGALVSSLEKIDESNLDEFHNLVKVKNTTNGLQQLAKKYRQKLDIPIVGITGSSGKTTTKELLFHILSQKTACYRSAGNYNTEYGLPQAVLNIPEGAQVGVFELAMQKKGEIRELAKILRPTHGVITTIGDAHLGNFPDRDQLAQAKWELVEELPSYGTAVLNFDSKFLRSLALKSEENLPSVIGFSIEGRFEPASFYGAQINDQSLEGINFICVRERDEFEVNSHLLGRFNVANMLASIALADKLGAKLSDIRKGILEFKPFPHRMEQKPWGQSGIILDDSYNANPYSTKRALKTLDRLKVDGYKKVFVFGDMLELGWRAADAHKQIGQFVSELDIDYLFTFGKLAKLAGDYLLNDSGWPESEVIQTNDKNKLKKLIINLLKDSKNIILIKGSRKMELDKLVSGLLRI